MSREGTGVPQRPGWREREADSSWEETVCRAVPRGEGDLPRGRGSPEREGELPRGGGAPGGGGGPRGEGELPRGGRESRGVVPASRYVSCVHGVAASGGRCDKASLAPWRWCVPTCWDVDPHISLEPVSLRMNASAALTAGPWCGLVSALQCGTPCPETRPALHLRPALVRLSPLQSLLDTAPPGLLILPRGRDGVYRDVPSSLYDPVLPLCPL